MSYFLQTNLLFRLIFLYLLILLLSLIPSLWCDISLCCIESLFLTQKYNTVNFL